MVNGLSMLILGLILALDMSQEPAPAKAKAKRVWTNEGEAPAAAGSGCLAEKTPFFSSVGWPNGPQTKFSVDERRALEYVATISFLGNLSCRSTLDRPCTLDELVKTVKGKGKIIGLARDPRSDTNYEYAVTISGKLADVSATPKRSGLGGFLSLGSGFRKGMHFNPKGPATEEDAEPRYQLEIKGLICDEEPRSPGK